MTLRTIEWVILTFSLLFFGKILSFFPLFGKKGVFVPPFGLFTLLKTGKWRGGGILQNNVVMIIRC